MHSCFFAQAPKVPAVPSSVNMAAIYYQLFHRNIIASSKALPISVWPFQGHIHTHIYTHTHTHHWKGEHTQPWRGEHTQLAGGNERNTQTDFIITLLIFIVNVLTFFSLFVKTVMIIWNWFSVQRLSSCWPGKVHLIFSHVCNRQ